ncbi:MAG: tetratricopeptide repeat protein, partial [Anaerolineae bacterium]|nr:tetratricopeptide repeat protein [Anaerolineae bacterium]
ELPEAPFYLLLLALLAAEGTRVDRPADPSCVLEYAWGRERDAWERHLRSLFAGGPEERLRRALEVVEDLAVLATLGRPFPDQEALEASLRAHFRLIPGLEWSELAERIPALFPRAEGTLIPPIAPDPLADWVLERRLSRAPYLLERALPAGEEMENRPVQAAEMAWTAISVLERIWAGRRRSAEQDPAWQWLQRATHCLAERFQAAGPDVLLFLREMERRLLSPGPEQPIRVEPARRVTLQELAVQVWAAMLARMPKENVEEYARIQGNLGNALSALGRREEALVATQEAAGIYRQLAQANPQAFLPDLAMSLNNLGNVLSALGRWEETLAATQEAVGVYRQLAEANPQAFLPDLAGSLNNLGNRLSDLGRREEALAAYEEALRALTPFFLQFPAAFAGWMTTIVRNYLEVCQALGRKPDEALLRPIRNTQKETRP